jgi:acetate kinase
MSGISGDARALQGSTRPEATEALEAFAFHIARNFAALATTLQGLDGIVFTGGIGEHQPQTRAAICERLGWLGVRLDYAANSENATSIAATDSAVSVLVISANEEQQIAADVAHVLAND